MSKAVFFVAAAITVAAVCAPAMAQGSANVQIALDKPVNLNLKEMPISQVFRKITEASGVRFVVRADAYDLLPYGEQTRLVVNIPNITLRNALGQMLLPLGLQWEVEGNAVQVVPTAPLVRMNRRATFKELSALGAVLTKRLQPIEQGGAVVAQLRVHTGTKELDLIFPHGTQRQDKEISFVRANRSLPTTAGQWLDLFGQSKGWTWYLDGVNIVLIDRKAQIQRQLQRKVTLRHEGADLTTVMLELAHKARVLLSMDPGVMDYVPVETAKNFNLIMSEATIAQALEVISGATGLQFIVEASGIRVAASEKLKAAYEAASGSSKSRSSFFVKLSIPLADGSVFESYIRAEDLPPEIHTIVNAEKAKLVDAMFKKYGITRSTTQPATTQPAE